MEDQEKSFKVKDKRMFDAEGDIKPEAEVDNSTEDKEVEAASQESSPASEESTAEVSINFPSFVASLGTQALMLMGDIPAPDGVDIQTDVRAAKQTIDILEMLKEKTAGNLVEDESKFFEEMLHNLRIAYLRHQQEA